MYGTKKNHHDIYLIKNVIRSVIKVAAGFPFRVFHPASFHLIRTGLAELNLRALTYHYNTCVKFAVFLIFRIC